MTTKDEIIQLAKQAGFSITNGEWIHGGFLVDELKTFANLIAELAKAGEREACAKVCDELSAADVDDEIENSCDFYTSTRVCAAAIRARSES